MAHSLDMINRDLEMSKSDRVSIHNELKTHDERLDRHNERLIEHTEQIKTLFKESGVKQWN